MEVFYPEYYHRFRCLAGACPDSCCKEWTVDVDDEAAARYRALPGALGDRLRQVLTDQDGSTVMTIVDGRCPMWQADGLCRIQAELGHDALCKTCRDFPRLEHDYGDFMELGLELSCPEAARLILTAENQPMLTAVQPGGCKPEYDPEIMGTLRTSRDAVLGFLRDDSCSVPDALAAILLYAHGIQEVIYGDVDFTLSPAECLNGLHQHQHSGDMQTVFDFFLDLNILTEQWQTRLKQSPGAISWTPTLRSLACYMVERYWLQSICDYDLVCRAKLAVVACLLVGALGGDPVETAQLFSKEIENDPDNVEMILDSAYVSPALTDKNLLSLLLN